MVVPGGWGVAGVEGKGGAYHGCGWGWMWPNGGDSLKMGAVI